MEDNKDKDVSGLYPVLPLRDIVMFPGMIVPLFVGREKSINALEDSVVKKSKMLLVAQKDATQDDPSSDEIFRTGVVANILQLLRLPDGTVKVLVEGVARANVLYYSENDKFVEAEVESFSEDISVDKETEALKRTLVNGFRNYVKLNKKIPIDIIDNLEKITEAGKLVDSVVSHIALRIAEKQNILEERDVNDRMEKTLSFIEREISVLSTEKTIRSRVRNQMEKTQKEYYLNEQMKAIQKELGAIDDAKSELNEYEEKIEKVKLSKEAKEKTVSELKKLKQMSPMSAESTVVRNYLDWVLDIPWKKRSKISIDMEKSQNILDADHYGLDKVKERVIEYLAVQKRTKSLKGQVICFVGPPGVGKTSLAKSIADATGRKFARISLGGVRDEAEIRGHRRTYIGSMPGKIVQAMKKAKASNPLILLDEIDKMGNDFRGDPAAALLEVLDPEQNSAFNDHYLELDYDLSDVMFITTANTMNIPRPLLDRMEIVRLSGYTEDEKVNIAREHLIARQLKKHGLKVSEWDITDAALRDLIGHYTRESGVRNLEREIAKLTRKAVTRIEKDGEEKVSVTIKNLKEFSGTQKFDHNSASKDDNIGVTTGLAYTEVGGDLLPIEAVLIPGGKGRITLTGKLGDVMQESAQAAWSYVRSRSHEFGIKPSKYHNADIHIHVPEGAIPKDGPSAGAAMCTTIVSLLTGIAVDKNIAMTGEISLRGMVMPIGGLKEKLLAALRGGITKALIPEKNVKDLEDLPDNVKEEMEIIPVSTVDEVIKHALISAPEPLSWEDAEKDLLQNVGGKTAHQVVQH